MLLVDFIKLIKKLIPPRTLSFVEDIVVYTDKTEVYKVLVRYNEACWKKLKKLAKREKLGVDNHFYFLNHFPEAKISDQLVKECKYERLTIIYNYHTQVSTVVSGEERTRTTKSA